MQRLLIAFAVLAAVAVAFVLSSGPVYRYVRSGPVGWELKKLVRDAGVTEVDIGRITAFQWTELFLFSPYTKPQSICKVLALSTGECSIAIKDELDDDGAVLLVFREGGRIVHTDLHMRYHGDFTPVPENQPLPRAQAMFDVVRDGEAVGGAPWLRLVQRKVTSR